jgi:hypothetical protein
MVETQAMEAAMKLRRLPPRHAKKSDLKHLAKRLEKAQGRARTADREVGKPRNAKTSVLGLPRGS